MFLTRTQLDPGSNSVEGVCDLGLALGLGLGLGLRLDLTWTAWVFRVQTPYSVSVTKVLVPVDQLDTSIKKRLGLEVKKL